EQPAPKLRALTLPVNDLKRSFVEEGDLDWVNAPFSFCASQTSLALQVGTRRGYLSFFDGKAWSTPEAQERLGALLQCRDNTILLHDFGPIRACDAKDCKDAGLTDAVFGDLDLVRSRRTVLADSVLGIAESDMRQGLRFVHGE